MKKKKIILAILLLTLSIVGIKIPIIKGEAGENLRIVYKLESPYMSVNDVEKEIDPGRGTKPLIIKEWERTVVPIRSLVETLGGKISWEEKSKKVDIELKDKRISLWINNPKASVNGNTVWIDDENHNVKPIIINGRTMIPLRFIGENLGSTVIWKEETKSIILLSPQRVIQLDTNEISKKVQKPDVIEILIPVKNNNTVDANFYFMLVSVNSPKEWFGEFCIKNSCYFKEGTITLKGKEEITVQICIHAENKGDGEFVFCVNEINRDKECISIKIKGGEQ